MTVSKLGMPLLFVLAALGSGCSIHQQVEPVHAAERAGTEICVVRNADVRENFLAALSSALQARGMQPRVVGSVAEGRQCAMYGTYVANWRWDLAMYLAYVRISVFRGAEQVGDAVYDSLGGGGNMNKFVDADKKINELVGQLFPGE